MGNRSSTVTSPGAPPPLLSAAVTGDVATFTSLWQTATDNGSTMITDRQGNNVLHALFSCRVPTGKPHEIIQLIHDTLSSSSLLQQQQLKQLVSLYEVRNQLGCTPLWILIAYGNVPLLQQVVEMIMETTKDNDNTVHRLLAEKLPTLLSQPNYQGDSPLLATCSQGNLEMVKYLASSTSLFLKNQTMAQALQESNKKGTTPSQIVVSIGHLELLKYLTESESLLTVDQIWQMNAAGLSLFHICSERNFYEGLKVLLNYLGNKKDDDSGPLDRDIVSKVLHLQDKNGANALHVACFCGHVETVETWIRVITQSSASTQATTELLDCPDGQGRTAYWLAMVQGHDETIGKALAAAGATTDQPIQMLQEIEQAQQQRASKRQSTNAPIDGNALLKQR